MWIEMAVGLRGGMPRKRHEDWNLVWIKEAEKRVEGRAEWRRLPAELSSCIVGTLSKILIQSVQRGFTTSAGFGQVPGRAMRQYGREGKY